MHSDRTCSPSDDHDQQRSPAPGATFEVPSHWSPQTAAAIFEFLCAIEDAVFQAHERAIVEQDLLEVMAPAPDNDDDDDDDDDADDDFIPY